MISPSPMAKARYPRLPQKLDGVEVVHLVGDGEGDDGEIGQWALRFDGQDGFIYNQNGKEANQLKASASPLATFVLYFTYHPF